VPRKYRPTRLQANALAIGNDAVLKIEISGPRAGSGASGLKIKAANRLSCRGGAGLPLRSTRSDGSGIGRPTQTATTTSAVSTSVMKNLKAGGTAGP
jgi:hypothetical protein